MAKLRIFGSIHFNTRHVVEDDLREFARGADAIAVEEPGFEGSLRSTAGLVLRYPLFFVGLQLVFLFVQVPLLALFNRDLRSTEQLAARAVAGDRPVHSVDRHPLAVLAERSPAWILGNWLAFLALGVAFPTTTLAASGLAVALLVVASIRSGFGYRRTTVVAAEALVVLAYWTLVIDPLLNDLLSGFVVLVGLAAGFGLIKLTLEDRNDVMLAEIAELAADNGYERVCLTTGYSHLPGMVDRAADHGLTTVDVFEPEWRSSGRTREPEAVLESGKSGGAGETDATDGTDGAVETALEPRMETAGNVLLRRTAATGVDWAVIVLLAFSVPLLLVGIDELYPLGSDVALGGFIFLWWLLSPPAYYAIGEARYGRTLGKSLLGLGVVRVDGSSCTRSDVLLRTVLHPVDFLPVGYLLGGVVVATTDDGQRLGDLAAGTTVVRVEKVAIDTETEPSTTAGGDERESEQSTATPDGHATDDEGTPQPGVPRLGPDESA